jgi:hypothetical protein
MRLSRIELCDLLARITRILRNFPIGSVEQNNAIHQQRDLTLG